MAYVKKQQPSVSRTIVSVVKGYMILYKGREVPPFRVVQPLIDAPEGFKTVYPILKRRAFKELEETGYTLEYTTPTQAKIIVN